MRGFRFSAPAFCLAFGVAGCAALSGLADYDVVDRPGASVGAPRNGAFDGSTGVVAPSFAPVDPTCNAADPVPADAVLVAPPQTIGQGIAAAIARGQTKVVLAEGTYVGESVTVEGTNTIEIEGGWQVTGTTWKKDCALDVIGKTVLLSPTSIGLRIRQATVTIRRLTISTTEASDSSNYGLWASNGANVRLERADVRAASGGPGVTGGQGAPAENACDGTACSDGAQGGNGAAGAGATLSGGFGADGYIPSNGEPGKPGAPGNNGTGGGGANSATCATSCAATRGGCIATSSATVSSGAGKCGCGGAGGPGGGAGGGGHASVGIFAEGEGTVVTLAFTQSVATSGGAAAAGGQGGGGAGGTGGSAGADVACNGCSSCALAPASTIAGGAAGGGGGVGGTGGPGGAGAGGPSFALAQADGAHIDRDDATCSFLFDATSGGGVISGE